MPRATWLYIAPSYKQLYQVILPNFLKAMSMLGYVNGIHYYIGKRPIRKAGFIFPVNEITDFANIMIFPNGFTIRFVSLSKQATSQRGGDVDGYIVDEGLDIEKEFLDNEISPSNRGNNTIYKDCPFHHGAYYFSSMPLGSEGNWLVSPSGIYDDDGYDFRTIMNELIEMQLLFIDCRVNKDLLILRDEIRNLRDKVKFHKARKDYDKLGVEAGHLHIEGNGFDNLEALGIGYFRRERKRITSNLQFKREVLNMYINKIEGGFYQGLDMKLHGYKKDMPFEGLEGMGVNYRKVKYDTDYRGDLPLLCGMDFGAHINFMAIAQRHRVNNTIKVINNLYTLKEDGEILDDLAHKFCDYYDTIVSKVLYLYYDASGNYGQINSRNNLAEDFRNILVKKGWKVVLCSVRFPNATHDERYWLWQKILNNLDPLLPNILFNIFNCREVINSMQLAPVIDKGSINKNKKSEADRANSLSATHASDALDYLIWGECQDLYNSGGGGGFSQAIIFPNRK
jgi:hypothetical protein